MKMHVEFQIRGDKENMMLELEKWRSKAQMAE